MTHPDTATLPLATDDDANLIRIEDLHKSFGDNEVLSGINAEVKTGEVVCVIGPSGSGKSTLLRCLNGLETITAGNIWLGGFNLSDKEVELNEVRKHVGMVFPQFYFVSHNEGPNHNNLGPIQVKENAQVHGRE